MTALERLKRLRAGDFAPEVMQTASGSPDLFEGVGRFPGMRAAEPRTSPGLTPTAINAMERAAGTTAALSPVSPASRPAAGPVVGRTPTLQATGAAASRPKLDGQFLDPESTANLYTNSMMYQVGSGFVNLAGNLAGGTTPALQQRQQRLHALSDTLAEEATAARQKANAKTAPLLRPVANILSDMVPFFGIMAIPYAGPALAAAYSAGEASGELRRAGLSERSQNAAMLASALSMGAAGAVGKALAGKTVTAFIAEKGLGGTLAKTLERAAVGGFASGVARQASSGAVKAVGGVYQEQVETARQNIQELEAARRELTREGAFGQEEKAAWEAAVKANEAIISHGGIDFSGAVQSVLFEALFSVGMAGLGYLASGGPRTSAAADGHKTVKPKDTKYFNGCKSPEEVAARYKELARQYHPDRYYGTPQEAEMAAIMAAINAERDSLSVWIASMTGVRAKTAADAWHKSQTGGVSTEEAQSAYKSLDGLMTAVREGGDPSAVAAAESIIGAAVNEIRQSARKAQAARTAGIVPAAPETAATTAAAAPPSFGEFLRRNQVRQGREIPGMELIRQRTANAARDTTGRALPSYQEARAEARAVAPGLSEDVLRELYENFYRNNQTVLFGGQRLTRQEFSALMQEAAPQEMTPQEADRLFDQAVQDTLDGSDALTGSSPDEEDFPFKAGDTIYARGKRFTIDAISDYTVYMSADIGGFKVTEVAPKHTFVELVKADSRNADLLKTLGGPDIATNKDGLISKLKGSMRADAIGLLEESPRRKRAAEQKKERYIVEKSGKSWIVRDAVTDNRIATYKRKASAVKRAENLNTDERMAKLAGLESRGETGYHRAENGAEGGAAYEGSRAAEAQGVPEAPEAAGGGSPREVAEVAGGPPEAGRAPGEYRGVDTGPGTGSGDRNGLPERGVPAADSGRTPGNPEQTGRSAQAGGRAGVQAGQDAGKGRRIRGTDETLRGNSAEEGVDGIHDEGRAGQPAAAGQGAGGVVEPLDAGHHGAAPGRGARDRALPEVGGRAAGPAGQTDAGGTVRGRGPGSPAGGDVPQRNGDRQHGNGGELSDAQEAAEIRQKTETAGKPRNYEIPPEGLKLPNGEKARYKSNITAINTMRQILAEGRTATPAEQEMLARYVGWGGIPQAFDPKNGKWAGEFQELKELLSPEEYEAARASTTNAHYTSIPVIRAIYAGLKKMGFTGGRILEPAAGVGNFLGAFPADLRGASRWTAVELDTVTGKIASLLYPEADVRIMGFENAKIPDNYMDLAVSNVPFGSYGVTDPSYPANLTSSIHNYFFAKSLDKVRPGGLVAFITSRYTMDSHDSTVRRYLMTKADLLGAVRLPDTAFKGNAGTDVVTDILILQKRDPGKPYGGENFRETYYYSEKDGDTWISGYVNDYFKEHPEMVLGTPGKGTMYRGDGMTWKPLDTKKPLSAQIEEALSRIDGKMEYPVRRTQEEIRAEIRQEAAQGKNGGIIKKDGKLLKNRDGKLVDAGIRQADEARMSAIIGLRDAARALLEMQQDGRDAEIQQSRKKLNELYDDFFKKYGPLHKPGNARLIQEDADAPFISALEKYDKDTKTAEKTDIFWKNTVQKVETIAHTDTVEEGLVVSMNEMGRVDPARIAELTGQEEETVTKSLLDRGLAYRNRDGALETPEQYLSGNVREKLREAEALAQGNPEYQKNVEALKKVIPADIPPEDITVRIGATWVPNEVYSAFATDLLGGRTWRGGVSIKYVPQTGAFLVEADPQMRSRPENLTKWGTPQKSALSILEATLNNKELRVYRDDGHGGRILDPQATEAVKEKQEKMLAEFQSYLWKDEGRRGKLARLYNDVLNNTVTPKYDGSRLTVNGANAAKPLRPHQKDAVQRIIMSGGNTLLAHRVGAGKTYEMAAAAMKLRQLGIVKKPMFLVPKSVSPQWAAEFLDYFPAAKILFPGEGGFSPAKRKEMANRIALGDWDAVIVTYEQFRAIPMSAEAEEAYIREQIAELEAAIEMEASAGRRKDPSVKELETAKRKKEKKLKDRLAKIKRDEENITFEQLGVDALFVDEAHNFKNLEYVTHLSRVSGLGDKKGSDRAADLYMKVKYLQKLNGGRGIVFATATPVMNSMSEMYIMQKYLQEDMLKARGLGSFDAWAAQFGTIRTITEMAPSGKGFRQIQSFSRFKNLAELQQMFRASADVMTEIPGLKIPAMKGGKRIVVECEPSEYQLKYIDELDKRAARVKNRQVKPDEDNMLKITTDGRKVSYTQRMIDPSLPYEDGCKVVKCADQVFEIWKETAENKGTQIIFLDQSTPKGGGGEDAGKAQKGGDGEEAESLQIYQDLRNFLIGKGIPAKEIAFIHDAKNDQQKAKLFEDVNEGRVRVLIGSTGKMGVGMNAQRRVAALHHLDAPWRPGDIEQREGRALRQGNQNEEVGVYVYVTKRTFDSRMWDKLTVKAGMINQIMSGDLTAREAEGDGDFALSAAEIMAIASGNPLIQEQFEVRAQLSRVEALERAHLREIYDAQHRIRKYEESIARDEETLDHLKADIAARQDTSGEKFSMKVGRKTYDKRKDAGQALADAAGKVLDPAKPETLTEAGSFAGFHLLVSSKGDAILRGKGSYRIAVNFQSPAGTIQSLEAKLRGLDGVRRAVEARLAESRAAIPTLQTAAAAPFDRAEELAALRKRNAEIMEQLNPDEDAAAPVEGADAEGGGTQYSVEDEDDLPFTMDGMPSGNEEPPHDQPPPNRGHPEDWTAERVGEDMESMRLSDLVRGIREDFGVNITTGHLDRGGIRGQYRKRDQGIRTKVSQDLPTTLHELGHHLDHKYQLTDQMNKKTLREIERGLDPRLKERYNAKEIPGEALAEYFRRYFSNSALAELEYPLATKYIFTHMSGKDVQRLKYWADEVNAYFAGDADTATSAVRTRADAMRDRSSIWDKLAQKAPVLYQGIVDSAHGISLFQREYGGKAYELALNAAYADSVAGNNVLNFLSDANGHYVGPGLATVLEGLDLADKEEYNEFGEYLIVRHGPERLRENIRVFADDRKNDAAWMERRQAALELEHPEWREIADRFYEFRTDFLQTWGVDTGLISQDTANRWAERWEFYVPLKRMVSFQQAQRSGAKRGFANQNSTIRKARGSGLDIINPVDSLINDMIIMINAGLRNNVMRELTDVAAANEANATWLEEIPQEKKRYTFSLTGVKDELKEALKKSGLAAEEQAAAAEIVDGLEDIINQYQEGKPHGNVITVLKNGKRSWWKINDPVLLNSLTNLGSTRGPGYLEALAKTTRMMTAMITGNDILWSVTSNAPRDAVTLLAYSEEKNPAKLIASVGAAYLNQVRELRGQELDPHYMEWLAMGGGHTSVFSADVDVTDNIRKSLDRKMKGKLVDVNPLNPVDWIKWSSDVVESGPRYAYFKLMRERGLSPQEAFFAAMDVTVNFRRGGIWTRQINKIFQYTNAAVQGTDKFFRYYTAADVRGAGRKDAARMRFGALVAASVILASLNFAINMANPENRKEYKQLSSYIKNNFFTIPIPGAAGRYFAIPKPRELAVFESLFSVAAERAMGNDDAFRDFYTYAEEQFFPTMAADLAAIPYNAPSKGLQEAIGEGFTGAAGSAGIIGVGVAMVANRDFLGRPIVSQGLSRMEPRDQYTANTSKLAYWLGQTLNFSPQMIDYAGENIFGGAWKYLRAITPVSGDADLSLGLKNRLVKDNAYSNDLVNRLYLQAERSERAKNSGKGDAKKAISYKMDSNMTTFYSRFHAIEKEAAEGDEIRIMRLFVLNMISEYLDATKSGELLPAQRAAYAVLRDADDVGDCLPTVMESTIQDGAGDEHQLTAEGYVEYQTAYNRYYWETAEGALPLAESEAEARAILKKAKSVAREMATNDALARLGAPGRDFEEKYIDLATYGITPDVYAAAAAKAFTIEGWKDRTNPEKTIDNSKGAQIAEMIDDLFPELSNTQREALLKPLGVGKTVLGWSKKKLKQELKTMKRKAVILLSPLPEEEEEN